MTRMIEIEALAGDGRFSAYVAEPAGDAKAAIVVIQEIFGVNPGIQRKCDKLAEQGYLAIAPDLFWRLEPGIVLNPDVEAEFQRGLKLFGEFNQDQGILDIEATIRAARKLVGGGEVGCVGYCLGGRLAYMTAARTDVDASVGYYAVGIDNLLHEAKAIAHPLMLHIGTADHFVSDGVRKVMHDGLDSHPKVVLHDYEGLDHGFATEFGKRRDEAGAQLADSRTDAFFAEHLQ